MIIVKVGGGAGINLEGVVNDLAALDEPFVVVHGANALRDELAQTLGKPKQVLTSVSGYQSVFSDENAIDTIMMSYAGLRNKRLVELFQRQGVNALGLTGLDGRMIQGRRNKGIRVKEGAKTLIKRDFSGKPVEANAPLLNLLLDNGYRPILAIPIVDENGFAINSENDDIVNVLQASLKAKRIIQLIEAPGYLDDANDESTVIDRMSQAELISREDAADGRIKRKLLALRNLLDAGAANVIIADGRTATPVADALEGKGTVIG